MAPAVATFYKDVSLIQKDNSFVLGNASKIMFGRLCRKMYWLSSSLDNLKNKQVDNLMEKDESIHF